MIRDGRGRTSTALFRKPLALLVAQSGGGGGVFHIVVRYREARLPQWRRRS